MCYGIIFLYKLQELPKMKTHKKKKKLWNNWLSGEHHPLAKLLGRVRLRVYNWVKVLLTSEHRRNFSSWLFHISFAQHAEIWVLTHFWPSDKFFFPLISAAHLQISVSSACWFLRVTDLHTPVKLYSPSNMSKGFFGGSDEEERPRPPRVFAWCLREEALHGLTQTIPPSQRLSHGMECSMERPQASHLTSERSDRTGM